MTSSTFLTKEPYIYLEAFEHLDVWVHLDISFQDASVLIEAHVHTNASDNLDASLLDASHPQLIRIYLFISLSRLIRSSTKLRYECLSVYQDVFVPLLSICMPDDLFIFMEHFILNLAQLSPTLFNCFIISIVQHIREGFKNA